MNKLLYKVASTIYSKITDGTHDSPKQQSSGKPLITSKHIKGRNIDFDSAYLISELEFKKINERSQVEKWDVIVSMIGEYCGFSYVERNENIDYAVKNVGLFKTGSKLEAEWLYYYLNSTIGKQHLNSVKSGSSQPYLTLGALRNLPILQPKNFDSKIKIVKNLSDLDAKIELNNKINAVLEAMAKTLYDYWFVQFDFPDADGKPYKSSGGKMVWNKDLKREIPEGWEVDNLSSFINNDKSGDWGKEQEEGNYNQKVYCVRGADINGLNGKGELKTPERYILEKNLFKTLGPHDLIVEISGGSPVQSTGRLAYITEETLQRFDAPIICSNFCKAITLKSKYYFFNFVLQWNSIYDAGVLFGYEGKTSGIKNLLFESFVSSHYTAIPPIELAEKFYDFMKPIQIKKEKNLKENQELASLRDWLLPMLMNGQVSVVSTNSTEENYKIEDKTLGMVAEPAEELKSKNQKQAKVIPLKASNVDIYKRTLLAAEIVYQLHNEATLGHLKLQKLLYLCQEINNMSLPMNFLKQAMGPYDNRLMRSLDKQLEEKRWFKFEKTEFLKYKPLGAVGSHQNDYQKYFEADKPKIDYLIATFRKYKSQEIEAVATLYACWKEAIENKELINLELILKKFYSWSKEKEKFNPDDLKKHLNWMKNNGIYPR